MNFFQDILSFNQKELNEGSNCTNWQILLTYQYLFLFAHRWFALEFFLVQSCIFMPTRYQE